MNRHWYTRFGIEEPFPWPALVLIPVGWAVTALEWLVSPFRSATPVDVLEPQKRSWSCDSDYDYYPKGELHAGQWEPLGYPYPETFAPIVVSQEDIEEPEYTMESLMAELRRKQLDHCNVAITTKLLFEQRNQVN